MASMLGEIDDDDGLDVEKLKFADAGTKGEGGNRRVGPQDPFYIWRTCRRLQALALIHQAPDKLDKRIRLAIYRAKGEYETMIGDNYGASAAGTGPDHRTYGVPEVTPARCGYFSVANLQRLNSVEFVSGIPDDVPLKGAKPLVQSALALIAERDQNLDAQIAITKARLIDARLRRHS